jgi:hypothetical protein
MVELLVGAVEFTFQMFEVSPKQGLVGIADSCLKP